jgi:hypothetical protein
MKKLLNYALLTLILAFGASIAAKADPKGGLPPCKPDGPSACTQPKSAPEVDPGLAVAGISLLAGSLTVMRARSRK